ncbi:site-specific integrase [Gordonia sp. DT30]|uniref:site-specific integrase n=1 Tax=Gordonia sp. DT30 TaxID=3416546 RepID=UPI003CF6E0EF
MSRAKKSTRRSFGKIRQERSGRYQASYVGQDARRHTAPHTFTAKLDAEGWLSLERRLIEHGEWTPPALRTEQKAARAITLREFAEKWIDERGVAPKTRALYRRLLDSRILPHLGDEVLADITPAVIRTWWAALGTDNTPTSSAQAYALARTIFGTAVTDGLITANPCQIRGAGRSPRRRDLELLTVAELDRVAAMLPETYGLFVVVSAWCGLRFGEVIELRRKDVQVTEDGMVLRIRRAATLVDGKLHVGKPKTEAGIRDVHVPPHVARRLTDHMRRHTGRGGESFVFRSRNGTRLAAGTVTKPFKAAVRSVGKPTFRIHDLRHVGAVLAAQSGATTKELMGRLGHTTPEMAMRYQHVAAGRDAEIARRLSKLAEDPTM